MPLFLKEPGAPIDNNIVERALKKAILNPRTHTCELNGANPFGYLTELQRHSEELKQKPSEWLPWNYREMLVRPATPTAA